MIIIDKPCKVREYLTLDGKNYYRDWLDTLPLETKVRIQARIFRVEQGNLGDYKAVGHGVSELRLQFGSGYRVYFGIDNRKLVILLAGGDNGTQKKEIIQARRFWIDYLRRR